MTTRARQPVRNTDAPLSEAARRTALYVRISARRRRVPLPTLVAAPVVAASPSNDPLDAQALLGLAHGALVRHRPGVALPNVLAKVRALLDPLMFGRDNRAHRDDVVKIAGQIDRLAHAKAR